MKNIFSAALSVLLVLGADTASAAGNTADAIQFKAQAEGGFFAVLYHKIKYGKNGTELDYRKDGGQDILLPFYRFSGELNLGNRHAFTALYQPVFIKSSGKTDSDMTVDDQTFPAGTQMNYTYNFPFWRFSYCYNLLNSKDELSIGASFQIRNAEIIYEDNSGTRVRKRDIGPVPLIKIRAKKYMADEFWIGVDIDGIYAPVSYLNGSDREVTGALVDAGVAAGRSFRGTDVFVCARYIAGGATSEETGRETKNWLQFASFSMGVSIIFSD